MRLLLFWSNFGVSGLPREATGSELKIRNKQKRKGHVQIRLIFFFFKEIRKVNFCLFQVGIYFHPGPLYPNLSLSHQHFGVDKHVLFTSNI